MLGLLLELAINIVGLLFWQDEVRNSKPVRLKIRRLGTGRDKEAREALFCPSDPGFPRSRE